MKIEKRSNNKERLILIGMIVDKMVLGRISSKWQRGMFKSRWANIIADWCVSFYRKYEDVPMNQIESLFESWAAETNDKEAVKLVEKFLGSLSEEYEALQEESNSGYIIDMAGEYFNQIRIERLIDTIQGDVDRGKVGEAINHTVAFNQIEMGVGEGINVLQDKEAIKEALASKQEPLIKFPKALGKFFQHSLEREGFIAFMGPEGRGKSFILQEMAWQSMIQRRRVAMFEVGDMSQNQIMRRFLIRLSHHPIFPTVVDYPKTLSKNNEGGVDVEFEEIRFEEKLNFRTAVRACKKIMKRKVRSKHPYLKLSSHPNSTLSVKGIHSILEGWGQEDWIPDVVVIDYADILDMSYSGLEGRDCINETWKQLRSLSQIYHCLVITATQADSASYESNLIRRKNFSEDKRKFSHVTGMIGINQTDPEEKDMGVMRLNWLKLRDGLYFENKCVYVVGCLAMANPLIKSCW